MAHTEDRKVWPQHSEHHQQTDQRRADTGHHRYRHSADPQRDGAGELDHAPVERDLAGNERRETKESREVEHVGADHDSRADALIVADERRNRGGDLGRVGRQRREHTEQRLGETESRSHPLEPADEHPTRADADRGGEYEADAQERIRHVRRSVCASWQAD